MQKPPEIEVFDRAALKRARYRASKSDASYYFLHDWSYKQIAERLLDVTREFETALQIGVRGNTQEILDTNKIKTLITTELVGGAECQKPSLIADEEFIPIKDQSLDLVFSALNLHSVNDLPGTLLQIKRALKDDGLFIAALFGGETLHELRTSLLHAETALKDGISPRVFPFADKQQMGALLQRADFALPVIDSEIITVTYDNMFKLMHDLRLMGEGNIIKERSRVNPGRAFFMEAAQYYAEHFSEPDGRIVASFEIIFLLGWAPHASQQKPLVPGSAQHKLADALKTDEIKTGDKAIP